MLSHKQTVFCKRKDLKKGGTTYVLMVWEDTRLFIGFGSKTKREVKNFKVTKGYNASGINR